MTTHTRVKKIDADTHFLPPVDMEELRQFLPQHYNKEAVNMLLARCWRLRGPQRPARRLPGFGRRPARHRGRQWRTGGGATTDWRCHWPRDPARSGWAPA